MFFGTAPALNPRQNRPYTKSKTKSPAPIREIYPHHFQYNRPFSFNLRQNRPYNKSKTKYQHRFKINIPALYFKIFVHTKIKIVIFRKVGKIQKITALPDSFQNRTRVKNEQDSRSHTKLNIKGADKQNLKYKNVAFLAFFAFFVFIGTALALTSRHNLQPRFKISIPKKFQDNFCTLKFAFFKKSEKKLKKMDLHNNSIQNRKREIYYQESRSSTMFNIKSGDKRNRVQKVCQESTYYMCTLICTYHIT